MRSNSSGWSCDGHGAPCQGIRGSTVKHKLQIRQEKKTGKEEQRIRCVRRVCHSPHVQLSAHPKSAASTLSSWVQFRSRILAHSQVVWVHNGKVWVLAVGGALVWAGGARSDAGHQRVVEIPTRSLRVHPRQPPAPGDGQGALRRSCPVGGVQITVLGNKDVVVPVLTIRAEGGGDLNTVMIKRAWFRHLQTIHKSK